MFKLMCVVMAILWLPLTQHCRLEAMGLAGAPCNEHAHQDACPSDGCQDLESGSYKLAVAKVPVAAPALVLPLFFVEIPAALTLEVAASGATPEEFARPLNWVPSWQFVRRAAPPSRAPSVSLA